MPKVDNLDQITGGKIRVGIDEGLSKTINWYLKNLEAEKNNFTLRILTAFLTKYFFA